jgi:hypothetical protein
MTIYSNEFTVALIKIAEEAEKNGLIEDVERAKSLIFKHELLEISNASKNQILRNNNDAREQIKYLCNRLSLQEIAHPLYQHFTSIQLKIESLSSANYVKIIPIWLQKLQIGEYSLTELAKYSKKSKQSLTRTLKNIGVAKLYKHSSTTKSNKERKNFMEAIYLWEGK